LNLPFKFANDLSVLDIGLWPVACNYLCESASAASAKLTIYGQIASPTPQRPIMLRRITGKYARWYWYLAAIFVSASALHWGSCNMASSPSGGMSLEPSGFLMFPCLSHHLI
jgi:hypothetical protein